MSYQCINTDIQKHKKNPLTFTQFLKTDFQDLTRFDKSNESDEDLSSTFYLYYLCIVGNPSLLKRHLDFMKGTLPAGISVI